METRHALAQALDAQAAGASARIEHLLEAGDRAGAEMVGEELCRAIDRGLAEGVSQEELVDALAKRQNVMARIAQAV
jgi:chorismate mutase